MEDWQGRLKHLQSVNKATENSNTPRSTRKGNNRRETRITDCREEEKQITRH